MFYQKFAILNDSKFFAGIVMIMLNIGSKYIAMELSETHEELLSSSMIRRLLVFTVFFIATRDIWVSLVLTAVFIVLVSGIFNENSSYCVLPKRKRPFQYISKREYERAQQVIKLYDSQKINNS